MFSLFCFVFSLAPLPPPPTFSQSSPQKDFMSASWLSRNGTSLSLRESADFAEPVVARIKSMTVASEAPVRRRSESEMYVLISILVFHRFPFSWASHCHQPTAIDLLYLRWRYSWRRAPFKSHVASVGIAGKQHEHEPQNGDTGREVKDKFGPHIDF